MTLEQKVRYYWLNQTHPFLSDFRVVFRLHEFFSWMIQHLYFCASVTFHLTSKVAMLWRISVLHCEDAVSLYSVHVLLIPIWVMRAHKMQAFKHKMLFFFCCINIWILNRWCSKVQYKEMSAPSYWNWNWFCTVCNEWWPLWRCFGI